MDISDLKIQVEKTIKTIKNNGDFPKENDLFDYKKELNFYGNSNKDSVEIFLKNFAKDIISFSNGNGGIIFLGIKEKESGQLDACGLVQSNIELLNKIDTNDILQKFQKICKSDISIDLQKFQIVNAKFFFLLIGKSNLTIIPINDFKEYKLSKGAVIYRKSGKNITANETPQSFNEFLQIKILENNKKLNPYYNYQFETETINDSREKVEPLSEKVVAKLVTISQNIIFAKFLESIIQSKLKEDEIILIHYIVTTGRFKLKTGWQIDTEISYIAEWEEIHNIKKLLSQNYESVLSRFEIRGFIEVSEVTSHNNPKEVKLKNEIAENIFLLPNEVKLKIDKVLEDNFFEEEPNLNEYDDLPF
jgi:hypothetical protein